MKSLVFQTDTARRHALVTREHHRLVAGPRGLEFKSQVIIETPRRTLAEMLVEVDDGASESDTRAAIQAAAMAEDWATGDEIARRYGLVVCLRCAADVGERPTWRLHHLLKHIYEEIDTERIPSWGEVCGPCAVDMLDLRSKKKK